MTRREETSSIPPNAEHGIPLALKGVVAGVIAGIVLLVALPVYMMINREMVGESIMRDTPSLDPSRLGLQINLAILYAVVLHAVDVALTIWLTVKLVRGRNWARIALTAYLVIATGFSLISAVAGTDYLMFVIPTDAIHLIMILLLWLPRSARAFFAAHRSAAPSIGASPATSGR